ncbi:MAG: uridine diphosphate-N-acetylglucosamine-binding protein YvcK [Candidatus Scalindua sediminis]|nr:uridine diphosphate-N-acetylglucosamine-binding protein YvcK [Candidatus Scalindua sediminis]HDY66204.1 uridine diphosphate-N-acetylglucosamine-binding protein YvcK [Candidatus Scalindua sp.]
MKAIIFDLDDTLYDCTGSLLEASRKRAAKVMVKAGLPCTEEEAYLMQKELSEKYGPYYLVFNEMAKKFGCSDNFVDSALKAYNSNEVSDIKLFPDVIPTLKKLALEKYKLFLLTIGIHERQQKKIELLKLKPYFDEIIINDQEVGLLMEDCFGEIVKKYALNPRNVVVVGDRVRAELRIAKSMGMVTVQMLHGRFKVESASDDSNKPDYKIKQIFQLPTVLKLKDFGKTRDQLRILAIGGGTGLPRALEGLKTYSENPTAIVTVTDSGRSSGAIREQYGILPPGDARNCLIALSESEEQEKDLYQLFQYRFNKGPLNGMSLGNLLMAALTDMTGSFELALKKASKILAIKGKVLPSTLTSTHICAELEDGSTVEEEFNVRAPQKPPIKKVFLKSNNVECLPEAISEINKADIVVIGPGSLYTSIISNLLVGGIKEALQNTKAMKIYICNIVTQPGQTDNYTASDCVKTIIKYLGEGILDYVLVNDNFPNDDILEKYRSEGAEIIAIDEDLTKINVEVEVTDLIENIEQKRILWEKQDLIRHDPEKLADSICRIYAQLSLLKD